MSDADRDGALPYVHGWKFDTHHPDTNPTTAHTYDETKPTGDQE